MLSHRWAIVSIAVMVGAGSPARPLDAQVKITPETLKVEIGERSVVRWFHIDYSQLTPPARVVRMEIPYGIKVEVPVGGGDETRSCGRVRSRSLKGPHQYVEWENLASRSGPWLGYPRCTLALTLTDLHGRTAEFPFWVTDLNGSRKEAGSMRLVIVGPGRSTWWMWMLAVVVVLIVVVAILRRPAEDS